MMLDYNPDIDGFVKLLSKRGEKMVSVGIDQTTALNTMSETYNCKWIVKNAHMV